MINRDNNLLNVPPLRFNDNVWTKYFISDFLKSFPTNSLTWGDQDAGHGSIKNIHYGLIHSGFSSTIVKESNKIIPFINEGKEPKRFEGIRNGDVILADASEDVPCCGNSVEIICDEKTPLTSGLHTIHCRDMKNLTVPGYKGFYFKSKPMKDQLRRLVQGSKIYSISPNIFRELQMSIPDKITQTKIVGLLSDIERQIETQRKIIEDLLQVQKVIIEKMYSNPSNALIRDCVSQTTSRNKDKTIMNVLSVSNKNGFVKQSEQFEDRELASDDTSSYKVIRYNMFAYNPARISIGSIARYERYEVGIVSPMYVCFVCNGTMLPEYLFYFFKSSTFKKEMEKRLEGSVRLCLAFEGFSDIPISRASLIEQKEKIRAISLIANILNCERKTLDTLESEKKFLLAQMFI